METLSRRKLLTGLATAVAVLGTLGARALGLGRDGTQGDGRRATSPERIRPRTGPSLPPVRSAVGTVKRRG